MQYYVYTYIDPNTSAVFYVGKGKGERAYTHIQRRKKNLSLHNRELEQKIDELLSIGKIPKIDIVKYFEDESDALAYECMLIEKIGINFLTNKINTPWPPVMPEDVIAKRAQSCKNNQSWRNTMRSQEHRDKLSRAVKKAIEERGGRPPLSSEHKAAVSRGCKGKLQGVKNPGAKNTPEQIYSYLELIMSGVHWRIAAKELNITNAFNIMHRRAWQHVEPPDGYNPPIYEKKKCVDLETRRKILELYDSGLAQNKISKIVGYSSTTVSKVVRSRLCLSEVADNTK